MENSAVAIGLEKVSETRKIKFRDDAMIADAKSRFSKIIDEIVLDTDEFIKAITDAINSASGDEAKPVVEKPTTKKSIKKPPVKEDDDELDDVMEQLKAVVEQVEEKDEVEDNAPPFDVDSEIDDIFEEDAEEDEMITLDDARSNLIRNAYKAADAATKSEVKVYLANYNGRLVSQMMKSHVEAIEKILDIVGGI